jgi:cytochrome P450
MLWRLRHGAIPFFLSTARNYGDIAYYTIGNHKLYLLSHPDYVNDALVAHADHFVKGRGLEKSRILFGQGLLTSEGEYHRRQRRLVHPAFHPLRVAEFADVMVRCTEKAISRWRAGQIIDINKEMTRLAMSIAGETLFGADIESDTDEIGAAFTNAIELFDNVMKPFAEIREKLPFGGSARLAEARKRLDQTIYNAIWQRRAALAGRDPQAAEPDYRDVLSRLLAAQHEDSATGMTDEQLRDECMTIFLAGHETMANALSWTWHLLGRHPESQALLAAEAREVLGSRPAQAEDVPKLQFAEMALAESMRLYPPVWMLDRRVVKPYTIGGYTCPVDSVVVISPYVIHHDARFFTDPEEFRPSRWTREQRAQRPRFSYFPFGAGPRRCIGESFAWTEGALILATIARRWRLDPDVNHQVAVKATVTLRPRNGIRMIPSAR